MTTSKDKDRDRDDAHHDRKELLRILQDGRYAWQHVLWEMASVVAFWKDRGVQPERHKVPSNAEQRAYLWTGMDEYTEDLDGSESEE